MIGRRASTIDGDVLSYDLWRPLLDQLPAAIDGVPVATSVAGSVSRGGRGGSVNGVPGARPDLHALEAISPLLGPEATVGYCASRADNGTTEILLVDLTLPHIAGQTSFGDVEGVVFDPAAVPEPYRRIPRPVRDRRPSAGSAPAVVADIVRRAVSGVPGASAERIAATERILGSPLPADVTALYAAADGGELMLLPGGVVLDREDAEEHEDDDPHGMRVWSLDHRERTGFTARGRFHTWSSGATDAVTPDPLSRVQAVGHSPSWFPIGDDWGGGVFVVDLAPGPGGTYGQLLYLDRHVSMGAAAWVAPSLTEYLLRGAEEDGGIATVWGAREPEIVRLPAESVSMASVTPETEVLHVAGPADLSSLRGHPALRALVVTDPGIEGLEGVVDALPALEYLELPRATWAALIASGSVPAGRLLAVGYSDRHTAGGGRSEWLERISIANGLLHTRVLSPVEVLSLTPAGVARLTPGRPARARWRRRAPGAWRSS